MSAADRAGAVRWLQFAADDLAAAETIVANGQLPARLVCFHCQQSIEKALKAILIYRGIGFRKTHDLNLLCRLLPNDSPTKSAFEDFSALVVFAAEARYPGEMPDPTAEDARQSLELAHAVIRSVRSELASPDAATG